MKYLGVDIYHKLSFEEDMQNFTGKASQECMLSKLFVSELQAVSLHAVQKFCCVSFDVLSTSFVTRAYMPET